MPGPGWIVTPGTALDYLREVDRYVDAIHAQVVGQVAKIPMPTLGAWVRFVSDWKVFFGTHQEFTDRLSGSVVDTTERYETDATVWRGVLAGFVDLSGVVFDPAKKPGGPTSADVSEPLKWAALLGGGLLLWSLTRR